MKYVEDFTVLYNTFGVTILIFFFFYLLLSSSSQRVLYSAFSLFYFMYNGLGISYVDGVHPEQFSFYWQFYLCFSLFYFIFLKVFLRESIYFRIAVTPFLERFTNKKWLVWGIVIVYLLVTLFPLVYPEFKLQRLISPPAPNVADQFYERLAERESGRFNVLSKLVGNVGFLIYPFYLVSLSAFRKSPGILFMLIFLPLYFHYCSISYINRGKVLETLFIYASMLWYFSPNYRKYITVGMLVLLPVIPIYIIQYQSIRIGNKAVEISVTDAIGEIVHAETIMPTFSKKIVNSQKRLDKGNYLLWMFTLPIPKVIIGPVPTVSAGTEMSEILLGISRTSKGYFALLGGLLNESIYTYGKQLFFLHAIFFAIIMALVARFGEFNPYLFPTFLVFVVLFSYSLNRGGVSSILAILTNKFLSLYLILGALYVKSRFRLR